MTRKVDFEEALKQLEEVVRKLEGGGLSLNNTLHSFEEGVKLVTICEQQLEKAEKKIQILSKNNKTTKGDQN